MARKKDKEKVKREEVEERAYGFGREEGKEALEAEGMKRIDMDTGRVELTDRNKKTKFIETYDEDTGELEGAILLKDGNVEGLLALVKIIEEVKVEQDHESNVKALTFNGKLNVENPSKKDRLWDIDLTLKNIESTNLKSSEISIKELGTSDEEKIDSREFKITGEAKNLLLVKEYINTLPDADNILNTRDIESDLIKLKDKPTKAERSSERKAPSEDEETDAGSDEASLESYGISIEAENTVTFAIAMRSLFEKPIKNIKVTKNIIGEFGNVRDVDASVGEASVKGGQLVWEIENLDPEKTVVCKLVATIKVSSIEKVKTGTIEVVYSAASSFAGGLAIDKFDAYSTNRFYIDVIERDAEPGVWDCKLVFENASEFIIDLFNADVYARDAEGKKFVDIDPNDVPRMPAGAQWHSNMWEYKSEDYPKFKKMLEFRVVPDFQTSVNGTIAITDVELAIASITGEVLYTISEKEEPTEKEISEKLIQVPTFKEKDVIAIHKLQNNGSAPLNEVTVQHQFFRDAFQAPNADQIKLIWDGSEVELASNAVSSHDNVLKIELKDLKNSSTGMFEPESSLEVHYPIHCINPAQDARFESEVMYLANTYPLSNEIEVKPEVPVIEAIHIRRKLRVGKEVLAVGALGTYKITLTVENIGDKPLTNITLLDKVPDNFEYGKYSVQPEVTDEVGSDTLKWTIEELKEAEKQEFTYEITGTGDYHASDAQAAY